MLFNVNGFSFLKKSISDFNIGDKVILVKEPNNGVDSEAIKVIKDHTHIGYVANSVGQVSKGCYSAGRIYDKIKVDQEATIVIIDLDSNRVFAEIKE